MVLGESEAYEILMQKVSYVSMWFYSFKYVCSKYLRIAVYVDNRKTIHSNYMKQNWI